MKVKKILSAVILAVLVFTMFITCVACTKPHEHTLQEVKKVEATCTEPGTEAYFKCTDASCGKMFADKDATQEITAATVIAAKGHKMTEHKATESTCTKEGNVKYYTCDNESADKYYADDQGKTVLETISTPVTNHQLTKVPQKDATCGATGTEAYWNCITCQKKFSDDEGKHEIAKPIEIPQLTTHGAPSVKFEGGKVPLPEEAGGSFDLYCSVCGKKLDEKLTYKKGYSPISYNVNSASTLDGVGTYYVVTESHKDTAWTTDNPAIIYNTQVFMMFKVDKAGKYTLSFNDFGDNLGFVRRLQALYVLKSDKTSPGATNAIVLGGKDNPVPAVKTLREAFDITYDKYESNGYAQLNNVTLNITSDNISTYGQEGSLWIVVGLQHVGADNKTINDKTISFFIDLKVEDAVA